MRPQPTQTSIGDVIKVVSEHYRSSGDKYKMREAWRGYPSGGSRTATDIAGSAPPESAVSVGTEVGR